MQPMFIGNDRRFLEYDMLELLHALARKEPFEQGRKMHD